jgi:hypothetical protein
MNRRINTHETRSSFVTRSLVGMLFVGVLTCSVANGGQVTSLVPVFAENVAGANGSLWQSELDFYNSTAVSQVVTANRVFPLPSSTCVGFSALTIQAGALAQLRSIGCGVGAAAIEILADSGIQITSKITNTGNIVQDPCCFSGFTQGIPVDIAEYRQQWTLANLQVPLNHDLTGHLGRHNLGIVNPNNASATVNLRYFDATGVENPSPFLGQTITTVIVSPRSLLQVNDIFPFEQAQFTPPHTRGFWRVVATADNPIYTYDSYVDNTTNDATFNRGH